MNERFVFGVFRSILVRNLERALQCYVRECKDGHHPKFVFAGISESLDPDDPAVFQSIDNRSDYLSEFDIIGYIIYHILRLDHLKNSGHVL
jgi:hypothetical protein